MKSYLIVIIYLIAQVPQLSLLHEEQWIDGNLGKINDEKHYDKLKEVINKKYA